MALERVDEHRERDARLELGGAARHRLLPARPGALKDLPDQRGLADAGLAGEVDRASLAPAERVDGEIDGLQLGVAPDKLPAPGWVVRLGDSADCRFVRRPIASVPLEAEGCRG